MTREQLLACVAAGVPGQRWENLHDVAPEMDLEDGITQRHGKDALCISPCGDVLYVLDPLDMSLHVYPPGESDDEHFILVPKPD